MGPVHKKDWQQLDKKDKNCKVQNVPLFFLNNELQSNENQ